MIKVALDLAYHLGETMKALDKMNKTELEKELNIYEQPINGEMSCYGVRDMFWLDSIYKEIEKRGYIVRQGDYRLEER